MRKMILLVVVNIVFATTYGQISYQQDVVSRIDFREKQNVPARKLPAILLQAFCAGEIQAYFPNSPNTPMNYEDFLVHFGIPSPMVTQKDKNTLVCLENSCANLDPELLSCFSIYMDFDESIQFDNKHSQMKKKITTVRLVYSAVCSAKGLDFDGPLFKMKDIEKLKLPYRIKNEQNSAANFTLFTYFQLRPFNAVEIREGEEYHLKPAEKDAKKKQKFIERENNMWEN